MKTRDNLYELRIKTLDTGFFPIKKKLVYEKNGLPALFG
jgi:hypothetical protein